MWLSRSATRRQTWSKLTIFNGRKELRLIVLSPRIFRLYQALTSQLSIRWRTSRLLNKEGTRGSTVIRTSNWSAHSTAPSCKIQMILGKRSPKTLANIKISKRARTRTSTGKGQTQSRLLPELNSTTLLKYSDWKHPHCYTVPMRRACLFFKFQYTSSLSYVA